MFYLPSDLIRWERNRPMTAVEPESE
jgi:hypothetical protein